MSTRRKLLLALAGAGVILWGQAANAFHDGGVAKCNGCHTMHNTDDNKALGTDGLTWNTTGYQHLLKRNNSTDTCLACHGRDPLRYGNVWGGTLADPGRFFAAGPFIFLTEDNINDGRGGATSPITGMRAGHSIVSNEKGTTADTANTVAPGGTYDSDNLTCTSCHDPHGSQGNFRLLYGNQNYGGVVYNESHSFNGTADYNFTMTNDAPQAVGVSVNGAAESTTNHTAYNGTATKNVSLWCANCHGDIHNDSTATFRHVTNYALGTTLADNYNRYNGTGNYTGVYDTAYQPLVPIEEDLATIASDDGATASSRVMCLSCHRAHATSAPQAGRWDFNIDEWAQEGVQSGSWVIPNPYAATAGPDQRSLCNKCHAHDPIDPNP